MSVNTMAAPVAVSMPVRAMGNVLVASALAVAALTGFVLVVLDGWSYYSTPRSVRGYSSLHEVLRPSGSVGQSLGIVGLMLTTMPIVYSLRKHLPRLRNVGTMKTWLEVHIFCGIVGPVFVTFHTSFRFNGAVAVAYWSMVTVMLSGFVGRYLYVRIPRSLRGLELTRAELDAQAAALNDRLTKTALPPALRSAITAFERRVVTAAGGRMRLFGLFFGELRVRRELAVLRHQIDRAGVSPELLHEVAGVIAERVTLLRRAAYLEVTKSLFALWHVFHMPLVYVMFGIVALHVAFTLYMGYVPSVY